MSTTTPDVRGVPAAEPKAIIFSLEGFYSMRRDLVAGCSPHCRWDAAGKLIAMAERGVVPSIEAFATGSMARRGLTSQRNSAAPGLELYPSQSVKPLGVSLAGFSTTCNLIS